MLIIIFCSALLVFLSMSMSGCIIEGSSPLVGASDSVYGGREDYLSHPSAVSLWYIGQVGDSLGLRASGVIVGPHLVLTSAHVLEEAAELLDGAELGFDDDPPLLVVRGEVNEATFDLGNRHNIHVSLRAFLHPAYASRGDVVGFVPENDIAFVVTEGAPFPPQSIATIAALPGSQEVGCNYELLGYGDRDYTDSTQPAGMTNTERRLAPVCLAPRGFLQSRPEFRQVLERQLASETQPAQELELLVNHSLDTIFADFDEGRKRVFLPTESVYHMNADLSSVAGFACRGDSGAGIYDPSNGGVVGLASTIFRTPCGQHPEDFYESALVATDLGAHSRLIEFFNAYQRFPGSDEQCMSVGDNWCWKDSSAQPSCGELGRMFGWRRLGLASPVLWNDKTMGWRLNCVSAQTEADYTAAVASQQPWYRLNDPLPFTLDAYGTVFPSSSDPVVPDTWDCDACYLWYGDSSP